MVATSLQLEKRHKLTFVNDDSPGITRRKSGRGWAYRDVDGNRIADRSEIDRLNAIALPPAYRDAWFCPRPNGHLLATGIDARGRKQYRYHPDFRAMRDERKFGSTLVFGQRLALIRKRVEGDLGTSRLSRDRAIASVVRLLDAAHIRIGNECYARLNGSFGASTLRKRHIEVKGSQLRLRYRAKSGKTCETSVSDRGLVRFVRRMQDLPGQRLFQYLDADGEACPVTSCDVNGYIGETMGEDFTAKHFRTWHASVIALETLITAPSRQSIREVMQNVADNLGNTPAIARSSYVHPLVVSLIDEQEKWRDGLSLPRRTRWLDRHERALLDLLENGWEGGN